MDSLLASVERNPLYTATAAPYLLLNRNLAICSANKAYLRATGRVLDKLVGTYIFDAFPDNPDNPDADGVRNVKSSLESVLRSSQRHYMWIQRYDIPGPAPDDEFIVKYWSVVNSPIKDGHGRTKLILNHAEDITSAFAAAARHGDTEPAARHGDGQSPTGLRAGAVAIARNQEAYASLVAEVAQLRQALGSRVVIEQAKGIVMAERGCGPRDAFEILREVSGNANIKLRDLAAELVATVQRPANCVRDAG